MGVLRPPVKEENGIRTMQDATNDIWSICLQCLRNRGSKPVGDVPIMCVVTPLLRYVRQSTSRGRNFSGDHPTGCTSCKLRRAGKDNDVQGQLCVEYRPSRRGDGINEKK